MAHIMHEKLNLSSGSPIKIKWCDYDYFKFPWHFHEEYEIVYVLKSTGTRFVGNNIEPFSDDDLVLLGSSVPHMYRNDIQYYQNDPKYRVHAITLQFSKEFFKYSLEQYPEFSQIKNLLEDAKYGIYFEKDANRAIRKKMVKALHLSGLDLLLEIIKILSLMSQSESKRLLRDESEDTLALTDDKDPRIIKVKAFLHREYTGIVSLQRVADIAGMNESAFCRYFLKKTSKTCFQYINELRITYACKLLLERRLTISQICYESGYNNISNFNRQFKKITGYSPTDYVHVFNKAV
ncbi:AraC family transcriptional regulator [Proteiniphilum sp.]|uniref:AraC family transcriptional regulator n=1 Tax=Proteiniphilum sp. TaxID=1926877 RepID=UPI002B1F84F9|nr:AraC family transcriptional regulator [Proteiniphilum sp.]MEA4917892.1 AraC family transcriptional regulator [Proteiniphilum sp.]